MKGLAIQVVKMGCLKMPSQLVIATLSEDERSGGGISGRAMTFCLARPGSNPGTDLAFIRKCYSILGGRLAISKEIRS